MATAYLVLSIVAVGIVLLLCQSVYNVFFHPLRKFPGPVLAAASSGWKAYKEVIKQETLAQELFDLHAKYGEIVRVAPNELHFGNPHAFHDIYNGTRRWNKDPGLYRTPGVKTGSFVFLDYNQAKQRRDVLLPIFSKQAINSLEHLVWQNATRLASSITKINNSQKSIDLLYAFRSYTLDTIMTFTFGNCVNALEAPGFADPLILAMDASLRMLPILKNFPWIRDMVFAVPPALVMKMLPNADKLAPRLYQVRDLIAKQLRTVLDCPSKLDDVPHQTIFHRMLDAKAYRSKTLPDMTALHDEGFTLIFAGANTVADTLLMGHWHVMQDPFLLAQLKSELRTVWPQLDTTPGLKDLESLPLLTATIKESLRFIPSGVSLTRTVPKEGATISGQHIPGGTAVGMAILHVHQSAQIWGSDALTFRPDRWFESSSSNNHSDSPVTASSVLLSSAEDKTDVVAAAAPAASQPLTLRRDLDQWLVPFSRGPRMCFGINLAWAELYIAFATMIRRFDLAIDGTTPEDMEWRECIAAYYPRRHLHAWCEPQRA